MENFEWNAEWKKIFKYDEQSNIESYQHNAEFEEEPEINKKKNVWTQNGLSLTEYFYSSLFMVSACLCAYVFFLDGPKAIWLKNVCTNNAQTSE